MATLSGEHVIVPESDTSQLIAASESGFDLTLSGGTCKTAEESAQKSQKQCRLLLDSAAEGICSVDLQGGLTFANVACLRLLGYQTADELLGRNMHAMIHHSRADGSSYPISECRILRPVQQGEAVHATDEFLWRKDGSSFPVEYWSHPIRDGGKVTGAVVTFLNITERKEAEQTLRESEERFREFAENVGEVFWIAEVRPFRFVYVSPAYEDVWGRKCDALCREPSSWWKAVHPQDRKRMLGLRRKQLRGERVDDEYRILRPDGSVRWVRDRAFPIRDNAGQIKRIAGIVKDVTEWKKTGESLRKSEARFRRLAESNMFGVFIRASDGRILQANEAFLRMLGYTREDLGEGPVRWNTMIPPEFLRVDNGIAQELSVSGVSTPVETEFVCKSGDRIPALVGLASLDATEEEIGFMLDLTERKRADDALRRSEEHFRLLFSVIPHPIWVYDPATLHFVEVNDAAVSLYGYSHSEFCQMTISDIEVSREEAESPGHRADFRGHRRSTPTGRRQHRTKSGRVVEVETRSHMLEFGGQKAVLVVAQDVTERKRLEVDLRHAQKLEAVGSLAAGIAHELNTPIQFVGDNVRFLQDGFAAFQRLLSRHRELYQAAVSGRIDCGAVNGVREAEEIEEADYLSEEVPKALIQTLDGVSRVATIVRAMKDFAHPSHGEKTAADLNKALASTLIVARNEIKYVADVETEFGDLPSVFCNLEDLNQVFLNLLVNAAHAIEEAVKGKEVRGVIRVKTWHEGDQVIIAVSDSGCGIPETIRDRIFDPFFTTKAVGRGTGQGLAISRSIVVEKHGGALTFESEVGCGTTFYVRLPVRGQPNGGSSGIQ